VEVYPHPGMIVVFGLERVLPYMARRRRPFAVRRDAMRAVVGHVEDLAATQLPPWNPATGAWREIGQLVQHASTPAGLRGFEDRLDAWTVPTSPHTCTPGPTGCTSSATRATATSSRRSPQPSRTQSRRPPILRPDPSEAAWAPRSPTSCSRRLHLRRQCPEGDADLR